MGFLYLAYAWLSGRADTLKEIPCLLCNVYIASPSCCKQAGCKKIDIYFTQAFYLIREGKNDMHIGYAAGLLGTNANM